MTRGYLGLLGTVSLPQGLRENPAGLGGVFQTDYEVVVP